MRCTIPEISWHNRDPVLSIDIQAQRPNEDFYRLASGGTDSHVLIWHVRPSEDGTVSIEFASDLVRHQKAVNAVRFSPCGEFLASGDDESAVIIWKQRQDTDAPELGGPGESDVVSKESWIIVKVLRGHLEDVYDICWSPDSAFIISGSVDNTAILWDINKGTKLGILDDHKGFVQGVAWDPKGSYVATLSSDRKLRVFNAATRKLVSRVGKAMLPVPKGHDLEGKNVNLFHDDTIQTFFRRLCFSPDGEMLIAPAGVIEPQEPGKKPSSTTLVFSRKLLNRPVMYLPSLDQYSVCVRCCPVLFELRNLDPSTKPESMFLLPYRIIFAVATASAVVLYDTQQPMPFGYVSNLHYTRLTDLSWSPKGDMLMVSSTDGYCSIITFSPDELGEVYKPKETLSPSVPVILQPEESKEIVKPKENVKSDSKRSTSKEKSPVLEGGKKTSVTTPQVDDQEIIELLEDSNPELKTSQGKEENSKETKMEKCLSQKSEEMNVDLKDEILSESTTVPVTPDSKKLKDKQEPELSNTNTPSSGKENSSVNIPDSIKSPQLAPSTSELSHLSIADKVVTPTDSGKKARRVQLITLSSPKSKKKLL